MENLRTDRRIMPLLVTYLVAVALPVLLIMIGAMAASRGLLVFGAVMCFLGYIGYAIYRIVYFWSICKDLNTLFLPYEPDAGDMSPNWVTVIFLGMLLPFYKSWWWVKQGNRLWFRAKRNYGVELAENGSSYVCWDLLGIITLSIGSWIGLHRFLTNLNMVCSAYNNGRGKKDKSPYQVEKSIPIIPNPPVGKGTIMGVNGAYKGAKIQMKSNEEFVIGRSSQCNLVIQDEHLSSRHCGIRYSASENKYYVTDYSLNGLFYKDGQKFMKNIATACPKGTVIVLARSGNEFLLQ